MKKIIGSVLVLMIVAVGGITVFAANQKPVNGKAVTAGFAVETASASNRGNVVSQSEAVTEAVTASARDTAEEEALAEETVNLPAAATTQCPNVSCPMNGECSYPDCPYGTGLYGDGTGCQGSTDYQGGAGSQDGNGAGYGYQNGTGHHGGDNCTYSQNAGGSHHNEAGYHHGRNR